jgi:hypothetical protein
MDYGTPRPQSPSHRKDLDSLSDPTSPGRACLYQGRERRSSPSDRLPQAPNTSTIVEVRLGSTLDYVAAVRHMNPYPLARFALPFRPFPFFLWVRERAERQFGWPDAAVVEKMGRFLVFGNGR